MQSTCPNPPLETFPAPSCACEPPLERLRRAGAEALCDAELLAVLLGGENEPDVAAADQLLTTVGGLAGLAANANLHRPPRLVALRELAVRFTRPQLEPPSTAYSPGEVAKYLGLRYARTAQEVFGVLYLDAHLGILAEREIFRGTRFRLAVEPAIILREGLLLVAAGVLLFHTHPGGSLCPSAEDLDFTQHMREACDLIGLRLVDHFILGPGNWCSLAQRGVW